MNVLKTIVMAIGLLALPPLVHADDGDAYTEAMEGMGGGYGGMAGMGGMGRSNSPRAETTVVLLMKDVKASVKRSWFNAYALSNLDSGYGGGSPLSGTKIVANLERVVPEKTTVQVVQVAPADASASALADHRRQVVQAAAKYGLEVAEKHRVGDDAKSISAIVQAVASSKSDVMANFAYWNRVAQELDQDSPVIEIGYRKSTGDPFGGSDVFGGDGGSDFGGSVAEAAVDLDRDDSMGDMMDMGASTQPQKMSPPTGFLVHGKLTVHWSQPKDRIAAVSKADPDAKWVALDVDLTDAAPVINGGEVAVLRVGDQAHAFSSTRSRWDSVAIHTKEEWQPVVYGSSIQIRDGEDLHIFTNEAGRWMSLSGATIQSDDATSAKDSADPENEQQLARWKSAQQDTRQAIDQLIRQHANDPDPSSEQQIKRRERLGELLRRQALAAKQVRQWRGRQIIDQASRLIEDAETEYQRSVDQKAIDNQAERLLP